MSKHAISCHDQKSQDGVKGFSLGRRRPPTHGWWLRFHCHQLGWKLHRQTFWREKITHFKFIQNIVSKLLTAVSSCQNCSVTESKIVWYFNLQQQRSTIATTTPIMTRTAASTPIPITASTGSTWGSKLWARWGRGSKKDKDGCWRPNPDTWHLILKSSHFLQIYFFHSQRTWCRPGKHLLMFIFLHLFVGRKGTLDSGTVYCLTSLAPV